MVSSDRVQVLKDVFSVVDGGQVLSTVKVNVQLPGVDTKVDEEGGAVEVTLGRGEMKSSVAIVVMLLWISSEKK